MRAAFQPLMLNPVPVVDAPLVNNGVPARDGEGQARGGYWRHAAVAKAA